MIRNPPPVATRGVFLCFALALCGACSPRAPGTTPAPPADTAPAEAADSGQEAPLDDPPELPTDPDEPLDERTLRYVQELYDRARESGEQVPQDVQNWTRETIQRVYSWDYKVERLPAGDPVAVEQKLTELGSERWECFHVHSARAASGDGEELHLYLKRRSSSFLRAIPFRDLLKFVPVPGVGGATGD